jgi:hypothetical protein
MNSTNPVFTVQTRDYEQYIPVMNSYTSPHIALYFTISDPINHTNALWTVWTCYCKQYIPVMKQYPWYEQYRPDIYEQYRTLCTVLAP